MLSAAAPAPDGKSVAFQGDANNTQLTAYQTIVRRHYQQLTAASATATATNSPSALSGDHKSNTTTL